MTSSPMPAAITQPALISRRSYLSEYMGISGASACHSLCNLRNVEELHKMILDTERA